MPKVRIKWVKSMSGARQDHKDTIKALGFHRLNETIEKEDNPAIRGMINKVKYLVKVETK